MTITRDYEDILYVAHTVTEMELVDRFGEPCISLTEILPHSLSVLSYLPSLLSFEIEGLNMEQLIGCCAVILVNKRFTNLVELSADDFAVLRFSEYILKEYQIPWKHFLDTCILSDEFGKPIDTIGTLDSHRSWPIPSLYDRPGERYSGLERRRSPPRRGCLYQPLQKNYGAR